MTTKVVLNLQNPTSTQIDQLNLGRLSLKVSLASCPPLIKGYSRLGTKIYGEPAWDSYFNTADILVMLSLSEMNKRYATHFLK